MLMIKTIVCVVILVLVLSGESTAWTRRRRRKSLQQPEPPDITDCSQNRDIRPCICLLGGFLGATLACLILFRYTRIIVVETRERKPSYSESFCGTEQPEKYSPGGKSWDTVDYLTEGNASEPSTTVKYFKLSEIPPDLEDLLVKKLDVRRKGERLYGWQKVGAAFKIANDDLDYLKLEYKRDNGSPTSTLLSILGITMGKTVSDLVNVLRSSEVKMPDVASLITRYIKATNKLQ